MELLSNVNKENCDKRVPAFIYSKLDYWLLYNRILVQGLPDKEINKVYKRTFNVI
jgi:hypothetical protein